MRRKKKLGSTYHMASIEKEPVQVTEPETQVKEEVPALEINAPPPPAPAPAPVPETAPPPPAPAAKKKKVLTGKALENHKKATAARLEILREAKQKRDAEAAAARQKKQEEEEKQLAARLAVKYGFVKPQHDFSPAPTPEPPQPQPQTQPIRYAPQTMISFVR